jgi:hypothetical protein
MGTWGTGIFADDTACDVRDDYRDMIADGVSDALARERMIQEHLEQYGECRADMEPTFWLALARTQWEIGRLDDATKAKALEVIDSGTDLENCRLLDADASFLRKRAAVLQKLRRELESPQKPYKKLRTPASESFHPIASVTCCVLRSIKAASFCFASRAFANVAATTTPRRNCSIGSETCCRHSKKCVR